MSRNPIFEPNPIEALALLRLLQGEHLSCSPQEVLKYLAKEGHPVRARVLSGNGEPAEVTIFRLGNLFVFPYFWSYDLDSALVALTTPVPQAASWLARASGVSVRDLPSIMISSLTVVSSLTEVLQDSTTHQPVFDIWYLSDVPGSRQTCGVFSWTWPEFLAWRAQAAQRKISKRS